MKARERNMARRLACFLCAIGERPALSGEGYRKDCYVLLSQYNALPVSVRKEARRRGRQVIRNLGLKAATTNVYPTIPASVFSNSCKKKEHVHRLAILFGQSLGRCSICKTWGRGKRAWPSREMAEEFRPLSGDMSLQVYECPANPGTYHLGHGQTGAGDEHLQPTRVRLVEPTAQNT